MKDDVSAYKAKPPKVIGSTTINHALRVKMGLGCMEYVLMECIISLRKKGKPVTDVLVWQYTGLHPGEAAMSLEMLIKKGFIFPEATANGAPSIAPKWASFFKSVEDEFDEFWKKDEANCWAGSKSKAKELYVKIRKNHEKDYIISQRDAYFEYLTFIQENIFNRGKMMATVFLGPQERFLEPWDEYLEKERKDFEKKKKREDSYPEPAEITPSTTTTEDRKRKYED